MARGLPGDGVVGFIEWQNANICDLECAGKIG
jgi:hypothetical protein